MKAEGDPRNETQPQRDDRNMMELLNELRVAGLGVQVLFGFLLSLPFTKRFVMLGSVQRGVYIADVLLCVISTGLLLAPVAYHRVVFRRNLKEEVVKNTNAMAIAGLICVGLAVTAAVVLVVSFVISGASAVIIGIFVICLFAVLWFVLPLAKRESTDDEERRREPVGGHSIER
jgi:Family of unknown function (DUF6328)